jgi:hypothetical protein
MLNDVGRLLAQPVALQSYLGRKGRAVVARLKVGEDTTVVVKGPARPITDDRASLDAWSPVNRFRNEVAALQTLDGAGGLVPRLISVDFERMWMVLEDLGETKSLADALLGTESESASRAVAAWASALGQLHRATSNPTIMGRWESQRAALGDLPNPESAALVLESARPRLEQISTVTPEVEAAAIEVDRRLSDRRWWSMTPRDPCPDNCALGPDGSVVLFDFEGGGIRHSLLDAAYLITTFPTCWCTGSLPPAVRSAGLAAYRAAAGWEFDDFDEHLAAAARAIRKLDLRITQRVRIRGSVRPNGRVDGSDMKDLGDAGAGHQMPAPPRGKRFFPSPGSLERALDGGDGRCSDRRNYEGHARDGLRSQ